MQNRQYYGLGEYGVQDKIGPQCGPESSFTMQHIQDGSLFQLHLTTTQSWLDLHRKLCKPVMAPRGL